MSNSRPPPPQLILGFPESSEQARRLAHLLGSEFALVDVHHFPDGESKVRLPAQLPERILFCRSLDHPNDKLIELMLACAAARESGARFVTLLAPYLCYMRQDIAFHPGEAVSQRIIGRWLDAQFEAVITVDAHLHRIRSLAEVIPHATAINLSAAPLMADFLRAQLHEPVVLGPDSESRQWVEHIARSGGLDYAVAEKSRRSDTEVSVTLPGVDLRGRSVVIADDMISTGHTIALTAAKALASGAAEVHCLITHPLFRHDAGNLLSAAGIKNIWSTDSITHPSNAIELASLLASAFVD